MGYHVFSLVIKPENGEVSYLLDDLLNKELIEGQDREPSVDHYSGNVTVYLMVGNKDKFLRHLNRRRKENADPVRFVLGKPTYLGYKDKSKKNGQQYEEREKFYQGEKTK